MLSPADQSLIAAQLGRVPHGVVAVGARCPAGHPSVIVNYPLRRVRSRLHPDEPPRVVPFPTLYWLTCPSLRQQVSHLERDGLIGVIEAEIAGDDSLRAAVERDHANYIVQRRALLTAVDRALVVQLGLNSDFDSRGIGGIVNRATVKCLHLHLAHHLAAGNAIGAILVERYGVKCGDKGR